MSNHTTTAMFPSPCSVLLADDDPVFRLMMRQFLEQHHYQVWEAENGQEAAEISANQPIDIVLLDGEMPVMNGFDACKAIIEQNPNMPILIVTANDDHTWIDQAFKAGAADYIHKPIHWQLLLHRLNYLIRIARETTERQQREKEMRKLTSALDQAGSCVLITDSQGIIQYINQAFTSVTGYTWEEVVGQNPRILKSGKQDEEFYQQMWQTIQEQHEWEGVLQNRHKNGSIYSERLNIRALYDDSGTLNYYVGVFSDITDQLMMEKQFRQSQKMAAMGSLVGGIAHNFNNMLAGINGRAEVTKIQCQNIADSPEKVKIIWGIEQVIAISMKAGGLMQQLLTYTHQGIRRRKEVDLSLLLPQAWRAATESLPDDIACTTDFCQQPMLTSVDSDQLQQVIRNIVNNACDALKNNDQKRIVVTLQYRIAAAMDDDFYRRHPMITASSFALLQIEDNGIGMDHETSEHIFEPFFTTKEVGEGTGLGLSVAMGTAEDHGGTLEVESEPGVGSTFSLWLPLSTDNTETSAAPRNKAHADCNTTASKPRAVLLVDDNAMIRETVRELLQSIDLTVIEADDGDEAVAIFTEHHDEIAAVVSDVVMPHMNGTVAVGKMREICSTLPVIFITGFDKSQVHIDQQYKEITTVISKPFQIEVLLNKVQSMLQ